MITLPSIQTEFIGTPAEKRFVEIKNRIQIAAEKSGRSLNEIRIIANSRSLMVDPVVEVARAGVKDFAEEFVPEGVTKRPPVDAKVHGLTWHFTGSLFPKTMGVTVEFFDWIHSFDRSTLLRSLSDAVSEKKKKELKILIEVNPLGVRKRTGTALEEVSELVNGLSKISGVAFSGFSFKSELSLSVGDRLEGYRKTAEFAQKWGQVEIAMGTSVDFERAIEMGASIVRLGKVFVSF